MDDQKIIINDIVVCNKDKIRILYNVKKIDENNIDAIIQGINYRIIKTEKIDNLTKATIEEINTNEEKEKKKQIRLINILERGTKQKYLLGKILHIDGDESYLNKCIELYEELGIYAYGCNLNEKEMFQTINDYVFEINPDIIIITGHDFYNDLGRKDVNNYMNTSNFIKAIKEVRKYNQECCIIAGACQSNFEALIANGATFASSPDRINVHTFDPAIIAIKVAATSFRQLVDIDEIFKYIENGNRAFGGIQTNGKMHLII